MNTLTSMFGGSGAPPAKEEPPPADHRSPWSRLSARVQKWADTPWRTTDPWVGGGGEEDAAKKAEAEGREAEKRRERERKADEERRAREAADAEARRRTAEEEAARSAAHKQEEEERRRREEEDRRRAAEEAERLATEAKETSTSWLWGKVLPHLPALPASVHLPLVGYTLPLHLPSMPALSTSPHQVHDATEWLAHGKVHGLDAMVVVAAIVTVLVLVLTMVLVSKRSNKKETKLPSLLELLQQEQDLSVFYRYWEGLGVQGPWDRPDLSLCTLSTPVVLFVPVNSAFQSAHGQKVIMSVDKDGWRKLLISHCAYSALPAEEITRAASCVSCTGSLLPLDCLRDSYTDGTVKYREPLKAANGLLFKIPQVMEGRSMRR